MDAYLGIAVDILRAERRPLSPRAILAAAYRRGIVPQHLYGKTQHKTLQARLSEDIVDRREQSAFFRTAPGFFFLREFLSDASIPEEFRRPVPTRRRIRELARGPALAISLDDLQDIADANTVICPRTFLDALARIHRYEDPRKKSERHVLIRSFVCVFRDSEVLTYRLGRYRDDRDAFMSRRTLGFSTIVHIDQHNLFNFRDFGIVDAGVGAAKIDLDIPLLSGNQREEASLACFIWANDRAGVNDLLAVVGYECPGWFEPVKRRLALNDLTWLNTRQRINNIDDFDPWSKILLLAHDNFPVGFGGDNP